LEGRLQKVQESVCNERDEQGKNTHQEKCEIGDE